MVTEKDTLLLSCGGYKTKINGIQASEFPLIPSVKAQWACQVPVEVFRNSLNQVLFAVSNNESRPELTGVSLFFKIGQEKTLVMAATDSYRLAECSVPFKTEVQEEKKVIVPARTLLEVGRILSIFKDGVDSPTQVEIQIAENQIVFLYGSVELISRTIEGAYPDYQQIIPQNFQTTAVLDHDDFSQAIKAASLFSRTGLFDVVLKFDPKGKQVCVQATDAARGENRVECPGEITGAENTVTVNYRYLLDGLNALGSEQIKFEMIDAGNPCLLLPKEEKDYLYIIMPIRQ